MRLTTTVTLRIPSLQVSLLVVVMVVVASLLLFRNLGNFLSPVKPIGHGALVIEGWVSREQFMNFVALYKKGRYQRLLTTGGPYFLDCARDDVSYASQVAKLARESGLAERELIVIPVPAVRVDRTQASAEMVARWISEHSVDLVSLDVGSEGPHARRSWLTYRRILEPRGIEVGVIAAKPAYDVRAWWRSSEGVKAVISETAGWMWEACCAPR